MLTCEIDISMPTERGLEIWQYVTDDGKRALIDGAQAKYKPFYGLSIDELIKCEEGEFECVIGEKNDVFAQWLWLEGYRQFNEELCQVLKSCEIKPTGDERQASAKMLKMTGEEILITFLQRFFGLNSYGDAYRLTVADLVLAKKQTYNEEAYRRAYADIQRKRIKAKK